MINERQYSINNNTKILLFILLIILTSPTILLLFINYIFNKKSNTEDIDLYNKEIRPRDASKEELEYSLLIHLDDIIMEGFWKDNHHKNGTAFIYYSVNNKMYPTKLYIIFRLISGKTIENWNIIYSTIYTKNIFYKIFNINEASINTNSSIIIEKGKFFKRESFYKTESIIQLNISNDNSSVIKIDGFIQIYEKKQSYKIFFGSIRQEYTEYQYKKRIKIYTIYLSILLIFLFFINQITIVNINNSTINVKSISIFTVYFNFIWSGYGFFFHFYFILTDGRCFYHFFFS